MNELYHLNESVHLLQQRNVSTAKIFNHCKDINGLKMYIFNEPTVVGISQCCSTVCWRDLNSQRQGGKNTSRQHAPHSGKKKAALVDKAKLWQCSAAEYGFDYTQLFFISSEIITIKNTQSGFMTPLLQFLLLPQTSLSRLIKQPGLPGYCLCIWLTGLCQPFNLPSKQHDHTAVSIQAIGSNCLTFCRTVVSGLLLGLTFRLAGGLASSASIGPHHADRRLMGLHWFLMSSAWSISNATYWCR